MTTKKALEPTPAKEVNISEAVKKTETDKATQDLVNQINSLKILDGILELLTLGQFPGGVYSRIGQSFQYIDALKNGITSEIRKTPRGLDYLLKNGAKNGKA